MGLFHSFPFLFLMFKLSEKWRQYSKTTVSGILTLLNHYLSALTWSTGYFYLRRWSNNWCLKWISRSRRFDSVQKNAEVTFQKQSFEHANTKHPLPAPWGQTKEWRLKLFISNNGKHVEFKRRNAYPCFFSCVSCIFHEYDMSSRQIQST